MQIDFRIAQLLGSRICHDLIGPVGAVSAGLELLGEDASAGDAAMGLIAESAKTVGGRLAFFRVAFGLGGGSGPAAVSDARKLSADLLNGGKVALDWPEDEARELDGTIEPAGIKLLLCLILVASETLPRGGAIEVHMAGAAAAISARGTGARLRDGIAEALTPEMPAEDLSAQTVAAHFTAQLARLLDTRIDVGTAGEDRVEFRATLPLAP